MKAEAYKKYPKAPKDRGKLIPGKYYQSWRYPHKLVVKIVKGGKKKVVHFGHREYLDYMDTGDEKKRQNYLKRAGGITNKTGQLTKMTPFSPNYHAMRVLWAYK